jgi:hypothetical protein
MNSAMRFSLATSYITYNIRFDAEVIIMVPSVKTLTEKLGLDTDKDNELRKLMLETSTHEEVDAALDFADEIMGGNGVESLEADTQVDRYYYNIVGLYVNMGDTYTTTLLYDTDNCTFHVTSRGDWVEQQENKGRYTFN